MTTVACWETEAAPRAGMIWHKNGDLGPPSLGPVRAGCGQSGCPSHSLGLPPPNSRRLMVATMVCSPLCLWRERELHLALPGRCRWQAVWSSADGSCKGRALSWASLGKVWEGGYSVPRNCIPDTAGSKVPLCSGGFAQPSFRSL